MKNKFGKLYQRSKKKIKYWLRWWRELERKKKKDKHLKIQELAHKVHKCPLLDFQKFYEPAHPVLKNKYYKLIINYVKNGGIKYSKENHLLRNLLYFSNFYDVVVTISSVGGNIIQSNLIIHSIYVYKVITNPKLVTTELLLQGK